MNTIWSGILLGVHSAGNDSACVNPADVDWF